MERIKGEPVTPTSVLRLVAAVGTTRAARMLGISTTTLHKARKTGQVSRVIEIAASAALERVPSTNVANDYTPQKRAEKQMFLLEVPADKAEVVFKFAAAVHAEVIAA